MQQGFQRGRDGFGFAGFSQGLVPVIEKIVPGSLGTSEFQFRGEYFQKSLASCIATRQTMICNHRAEPTNEFLPHKVKLDQQPYCFQDVFAVHNGTIANDKELFEAHPEWGQPVTSVDSAVIPFVLHEKEANFKDLKGSMAIAAYNTRYNTLCLYRNYQPIYLFRDPGDVFLFSSVREVRELLGREWREVPFPPYSRFVPLRNGSAHTMSDERTNTTRSMVICSGGLDSTTVAAIAASQESCKELTLLHLMYSCKAQQREIDAVLRIMGHLRMVHPEKKITAEFVDMTWLGRLGGSSLTEAKREISQGNAGVEFAHEWVPARNTAMIGIAASYADRYDIGKIFLGLNLEESGAYPDNTIEFFQEFNRVLDVGTQARPQIENPLCNLMKHEIVKLALQIGAPIDLAWSCYEGGLTHCGRCGPCTMRRVAFQMNGLVDKMVYA